MNDSRWQQLQNLKDLYENGFMTKEEYALRKQQLIDELTGTSISSDNRSTRSRSRINSDGGSFVIPTPTVMAHPPPDFSVVQEEQAIKFTFHWETKSWIDTYCKVKIDDIPFAKGGLRLVYYLLDVEEKTMMVAKRSIDPRDNESKKIYFLDVEIQGYAKHYAKLFNHYNPPKEVDFVSAFIIQLCDRDDKPIYGVEKYIAGDYRKHNNNFGYVSQEERNTPQAFSHFSYESSKHKLLICDIQGVGDLYTDPQIHTIDGPRMGKGDLKRRGIEKFLETHRCNPICRYLKLPPINAEYDDDGTMPAQTVMAYTAVSSEGYSPNYVVPITDPSVGLLSREQVPKETTSACPCCTIL
eukprot:TRINITY_DN11872_c0_g1_i5.p1 TRINITY_DN11872_c0_g1~~TRINITY_DN11872_c0_g1_i5.p1  ORF type:complete len:354 (+),score=62.36 TRINITY_DN11872_c0_g1_i5:221-1282(+)